MDEAAELGADMEDNSALDMLGEAENAVNDIQAKMELE